MKTQGMVILVITLVVLVLILIVAMVTVATASHKRVLSLFKAKSNTRNNAEWNNAEWNNRSVPRAKPLQPRKSVSRTTPVKLSKGLPKTRAVIPDGGTAYRRLLYIPGGVQDGDNITGSALRELEVAHLGDMDAEDLCAFTYKQEDYVLITSGGQRAILCQENQEAREIKFDVDATDVAIHNSELYLLSDKKVYSCSLRAVVHSASEVETSQIFQLDGVLSIEAPHDQSCVYFLTAEKGLVFADGNIREVKSADGMAFGSTYQTHVLTVPRGLRIMPNDEEIEDLDLAILSPENRIFGLESAKNPWLSRIRTLDGEPVFFTRNRFAKGMQLPQKVN